MNIPTDIIDNIKENHTFDVDILQGSIDIVKEFIRNKQYILYGGQSLDYSFKLKGDVGIYKDVILPDYDFISDHNYDDSIDLFINLESQGFQILSAINAFHPTTRRVRVRFYTVADITYMPTNILDSVPYLEYQGFRLIHPTFQRADLHSSLAFPYENPPGEVILDRVGKDLRRLEKLNSLYPVEPGTISPTLTRYTWDSSGKDDLIINGYLAFAAYTQYLREDLGIVPPVDIAFYKEGSVYSYDAPTSMVSLVSNHKIPLDEYTNFRLPYMEIRPYAAYSDDLEVYFWITRISLYNIYKDLKIVSFHQLCLYFIQAYFEKKDDTCLLFYSYLLDMIRSIKDISRTYFFFPFNKYGRSVPTSSVLNILDYQRKKDILLGKEASFSRPNPPAYYSSEDEVAKWDYNTFIYDLSGQETSRDYFEQILDKYEGFSKLLETT